MHRGLILLLLPLFLLAACGGGGDRQDVEELLDRAFRQEIRSADLTVDATLQLRGSEELRRPVRIRASGPFRGNEGRLPSVDIELRVGTDGAGQVIETGFLSTGDRAFVKFQDVYYEQPAAQVRRANEALRKEGGRGSSLSALGIDPRDWLAEARDEGEETVAGVTTRHVSGTLEVGQLMRDLNEFVRRSSGAIGGATGQTPPEPLGAEDIEKITEVVKNPTFDVYVGTEDHTVRRVSGRVELAVPEEDRAGLGGVEGGSLEFFVEFREVNGDQEITAPANARPLADLTRSLGGAGALGELGGGTPDAEPSPLPLPEVPDDLGPNGSGGSAPPDAEDFRAYAECLDEAQPQDTDALQHCAELLR